MEELLSAEIPKEKLQEQEGKVVAAKVTETATDIQIVEPANTQVSFTDFRNMLLGFSSIHNQQVVVHGFESIRVHIVQQVHWELEVAGQPKSR